jgi:hypothetical protein
VAEITDGRFVGSDPAPASVYASTRRLTGRSALGSFRWRLPNPCPPQLRASRQVSSPVIGGFPFREWPRAYLCPWQKRDTHPRTHYVDRWAGLVKLLPVEILQAVARVAANEPILSPSVTRQLLAHIGDTCANARRQHARTAGPAQRAEL